MEENKNGKSKIQYNSNDAPPPKNNIIINLNDLLVCPECSSSIEIINLDEVNNMLEFKCSKNNHKNNQISIAQYLKNTEKNQNIKNLNEFKDKCDIHKNNYYVSYCFDCKSHLCNECLQNGKHINHKKNNLIEVKPGDKELIIISEVIKKLNTELKNLNREKEIKSKELNEELKIAKKKENKILNNGIKLFKFKNNIELEQNTKKYLSDICEIKKKYNEEIKKAKIKYEAINVQINSKYKLKNKKQKIYHDLKIKELNKLYKNKIDVFQFDLKIENLNGILKLNENVLKLYKSFNNNYFNSMNINNILKSYSNNKSNNEKMIEILGNDYEKTMNIVNNKFNEGISLLKNINEMDELKKRIKQEELKSKELSEMNIELNKKNERKEEENNTLKEEIKKINKSLNKITKEKEEETQNNKKEIKKLNQIIKEKQEKIERKEKEFNEAKNCLNKYQKYFGEEMKEIENFQKQNSIINFTESPFELRYEKKLVNDRRNSGLLNNIAVYSKNNRGYLVYQEIDYDLIVMRINDDDKIANLIGHKIAIAFIRYYQNKNNLEEEYILSGDGNKLVIIWDINNNFEKKYSIQPNYKEKMFDALILFNLFNKNYILLASDNQHDYNEFTKLYELNHNTQFIKNIYNTNRNKTAFLIPWLYKNKYYIISCCDYEISINNIFEDENYANLILKPEGGHYCGFLYNDNYLCVSDTNNNFLRIWDLTKKTVYKTIKFDAEAGYEMVQWNEKFTIIGSNKSLIIIDIEEEKYITKIEGKNGNILGVKKIKDEEFGECLICSEANNTISLYKIEFIPLEPAPKDYDDDDSSD